MDQHRRRPAAAGGTGQATRGLHADITERRQTEEELRRTETLLRAVSQNTTDGIYIKDTQSRLLYANEACLRLVGKPAEQVIGHTDQEFFDDPEIGQAILNNDRRIMATGEAQVFEETIETPQGRRVMLFSKAPWRDAQGKIVGVLGISRDVTERKRAEEAERRAREVLEMLMDTQPMHVCVIRGSDLRIVMANSAYRALARGRQVVGKTLEEVWPETGKAFSTLCRKVLETQKPYEVQDDLNTIRRTPDGPPQKAYFSWSLYPVRLPGQEGWFLLNPGWDTTARKQAEEDLRASEQRFRSLADAMPQIVWTATAEGVVDYYNAGAVQYGLEVAGRNDHDWAPQVHPDDVASTLQEWRSRPGRDVRRGIAASCAAGRSARAGGRQRRNGWPREQRMPHSAGGGP